MKALIQGTLLLLAANQIESQFTSSSYNYGSQSYNSATSFQQSQSSYYSQQQNYQNTNQNSFNFAPMQIRRGTPNPAYAKFEVLGSGVQKFTMNPQQPSSSQNSVYVSYNSQFNQLLANDAGYTGQEKNRPLEGSGKYGIISDPNLLRIMGIDTPSAKYQQIIASPGKFIVIPSFEVIQSANNNYGNTITFGSRNYYPISQAYFY